MSVKTEVPNHVAIIMDGNGRWAKQRNKIRSFGHKEGLNTVRKISQEASDLGINFLSLYAFSTENWKRTEQEVKYLMNLIVTHLVSEYNFYAENSIRVVHSGDINRLPDKVKKEILKTKELTKDFTGLTINICINYGGKDEIVRAVNKAIEAGRDKFTETTISENLDYPEIPDVDLIIRTGGDYRISNFLLWQSAYAELFFTPVLWPDFTNEKFRECINNFISRDRRFGGI